MNDFRIPWAMPFLGDEEILAVTRALADRRLSMGAEVRAFEAEAAALVNREHGVAVANGTVALDLAMKLIGVGPGDEVIVSALSYIATTNCIFWQGARPVFCDVDPATLNIDPADVERRITHRTKAVLVADYCGSPVDYDRIESICEDHGLVLAVDGAQSLGAYHRGRPTCSIGTVSTTSFHTAKAMICGEGGMVFCDDDALADRARKLRGQGEVPGRKYVHDVLAWNYRLTEIAGAIGRVQLGRADDVLVRRAELAARYTEQLRRLPQARPTAHCAEATPAWFSYAICVPNRDAVAQTLADLGVETRSLYPLPAYRQPIPEYREYAATFCPHAELASGEVLNLPMFYEMTDAQVDDVVGCLSQALAANAPEAWVGYQAA
ncbi:MAG TPA: DegT/DnrJ/EryC1/StrS family aminotransferase [Solirubrobacteraceae bacterium]|jgi:perosamine synthetase